MVLEVVKYVVVNFISFMYEVMNEVMNEVIIKALDEGVPLPFFLIIIIIDGVLCVHHLVF